MEVIVRADGSVCPKCGGTGIIVTEAAEAKKCDCGAWQELQYRQACERARITNRNIKKRLDTFVASGGDPEKLAIKNAATSYANTFTPDDKGLLLRGGVGTGKTHIAVGVLKRVLYRGHSGLFCNVTDFLQRLKNSYSLGASSFGRKSGDAEDERDVMEEMQEVDLLVLDDLGAESPSAWSQDRIYLIVNSRYEMAKPMVVTTNCTDAELHEKIGPRTLSRLWEMCEVLDFPDGDYRREKMRQNL